MHKKVTMYSIGSLKRTSSKKHSFGNQIILFALISQSNQALVNISKKYLIYYQNIHSLMNDCQFSNTFLSPDGLITKPTSRG